MYPALLLVPLIYAFILAAFAFVPGIIFLGVALAMSAATRPRGQGPSDSPGCLGCVRGVMLGTAILLLSISCGLVGTGLFSVLFNLVLIGIALIADFGVPKSGADMDGSGFRFLYIGVLFLSFLAFFSFGMARLVMWLRPKDVRTP